MAGVQTIVLGALSAANYRRLVHVGFSHRQAQYLVGAKTAARQKTYRSAFTRHQFKALRLGATMKTLLSEGHFTRNQAKLLLELGLLPQA